MLVIPTKLGRDIAWGKGHLVREYDLDLGEMAAILKVKKLHFCTFLDKYAPKWHETIFFVCLVNFSHL